ncbi:hypothetical protein Snoj_04580 [Streptomyces nojiriensis]|uniref:NACHT domain-containing protein n=1 Tax=Streptomyces nojiriensis TaxID=66374 RepID=A0ABQ3SF74_9ACTN|nr:NACHT domain-containing protein [Streptomyces nojiriensis]QTI48190.1 hypothetical protein JYK04_06050 [Streptomyces nojiriensis]GGS26002.1 hypothetical protein GCM10010205_65050 [Streptomyces nojiriensis]GHI66540.1 hypothetical protein Snoj_04580 [Streptomyces nojiriensis]
MPIDDGAAGPATPAEQLATELRALRDAAGRPSLRTIASGTGRVSHTTVAEALQGRRVLTWPVLAAIVKQLGGDESAFRARWIAATSASPTPTESEREETVFIARYRERAADYYNVMHVDHVRRARFEDLYVTPRVSRALKSGTLSEGVELDVQQFDSEIRRAVLLGGPGAGKTTLCQALICRHAQDADLPVAFLVRVREFAADFPPERSVVGYIEHHLEAVFQLRLPQGLLERKLQREPLLVIFDALDDVPDAAGQNHLASIIKLFSSEFPLTRILITSRASSYRNAHFNLARFDGYNLEGFNGDEAREFAKRWFAYQDGAGSEDAESKSRELIRQSSSVADLRKSPLAWTILCSLYEEHGDVPRSIPAFFSRWWQGQTLNQSRHTDATNRLQEAAQKVLPHVAYYMLRNNRSDLSGDQFISLASDFLRTQYETSEEAWRLARETLDYLSQRTAIFTALQVRPDGSESYGFFHRSFMEYEAALYEAWQIDNPHELAESVLRRIAHGDESFSGELVVQLSERYREGKGVRVISEILDATPQLPSDLLSAVIKFLERCSHLIALPYSLDAQILSLLNAATTDRPVPPETLPRQNAVSLTEEMSSWGISKNVPGPVSSALDMIRGLLVRPAAESQLTSFAVIWGWATLEDCLLGFFQVSDLDEHGQSDATLNSKLLRHSTWDLVKEAERRGLLTAADTGQLSAAWKLRNTLAHGPGPQTSSEVSLLPAVQAVEAIQHAVSQLFQRAAEINS